jgi:ethanolamine utilization protein EutM
MANIKAIGVLETKGLTPLIKGADSASKAANVDLIEWRRIGGGYVSFTFEGEVAAVKSAMDAASEAASEVGDIVSELVISRPIEELKGTFKKPDNK